jgi:penicillin G amidase
MSEHAQDLARSSARSWGRRLRRGTLWSVAALLLILLGVGLGGYVWLRQALPQVDGTIHVAGLDAPVTIGRDRFSIPHIEAESLEDAAFAQGFVHAQDRLWQMEFQRRLGAGRLAEIAGAPALATDRFMRTIGFYRLAEASLAHLEPETIAWLEAYAAGVNAFLASRSGPLPPEFLLLRQREIEPWSPVDSLVWIRLMAFDLSTNYREELLRARLSRRLTPRQIADFWPEAPGGAPVTLAALARELRFDELVSVLPGQTGPRPGSNAWAAAGRHTASGAPLLANDPHLGMQAPGTFYLVRLSIPGFELAGASLPGVPGVVLGQNGSIAWGFTTTGADTQDLFIERIDSADGQRYLTPDGAAPFTVREEVISVRDAEPVTLRVRSTRHGPVISDLLPELSAKVVGPGRVAAFAWAGLAEDDTSLQALLKFNRARDWRDFTTALRDVVAPIQNILYADASGRIGMYTPGRIPIRRRGDGRWPVPGWTGEHDWEGFVPFEDLPHALDPRGGVLLNANNQLVPDNYPYFVAADWDPPLRARRIEELIGDDRLDIGRFAAMQADVVSMVANDLLPLMLAVDPESSGAAGAKVILEAWDRVARPDAAEPLIFAAWYRELSRLIYADELGDLFQSVSRDRPVFMRRVLSERRIWCDDVNTKATESCEGLLAKALDAALAELRARFGDDMDAWRWGEAHPALMAHQVLGDLPVLSAIFTITVPTGGDGSTVNVGHYSMSGHEQPFASINAAAYRGLYDLANPTRSHFVAATGQSGNPLSSHYRDLTALWARGESVPIQAAPAGLAATLTLEPR